MHGDYDKQQAFAAPTSFIACQYGFFRILYWLEGGHPHYPSKPGLAAVWFRLTAIRAREGAVKGANEQQGR